MGFERSNREMGKVLWPEFNTQKQAEQKKAAPAPEVPVSRAGETWDTIKEAFEAGLEKIAFSLGLAGGEVAEGVKVGGEGYLTVTKANAREDYMHFWNLGTHAYEKFDGVDWRSLGKDINDFDNAYKEYIKSRLE